jgi:hypothetical protein
MARHFERKLINGNVFAVFKKRRRLTEFVPYGSNLSPFICDVRTYRVTWEREELLCFPQ